MKELILVLPEIWLALTIAGIIGSEIGYFGEKNRLILGTALFGLAAAFIQTLLTYESGPAQVFANTLSVDGFSLFFKLIFIVLAALSVFSSRYTLEINTKRRAEYYALIIGAALAMCVAASASDVLLAFLALQFMNILTYFLAAYVKDSIRSTESAVKYLAFGAVSGTLFLFGLAILFAYTHTLNIYDMHKILAATPLARESILVVFMLMFLSFCFQFTAFPMSLWTPDVLEGAPTPVSAFLSVGPRAAGFAVALRFLLVLFTGPSKVPGQWEVLGNVDWPRIVALISGMTMVFGSLLAYRQTAAKRLIAYLVVAETGFLLLGLLVLDQVGVAAILFNIVVQLFSIVGAYYVIALLYDQLRSDQLKDLKGMLSKAVPECVSLILFLACLVGLPPFPGFIGKFILVGAAIRHQWYFLAVLAIISAAVGSLAVARLAFSVFGEFSPSPVAPMPADPLRTSRRMFLVVVFIPMVLIGVFAEQVLSWAGQSLRFILW